MAEVAKVQTNVTEKQLIETMALVWDHIPGDDQYSPSPRTLCLLAAQWALETASGSAMMNYNVAGIKAGPTEQHTYYWTFEDMAPAQAQAVVDASTTSAPAEFRDPKVLPDGRWRVWVGPKHPAARFRAYDSLSDGVIDYLARLKRGRFSAAWTEVLHGNPTQFAQKLKDLNYYTADVWAYAHLLAANYNRLLAMYGGSARNALSNIKGAWDVTIGNWSGIFLFSGTADVSWEDPKKAKGVRHKGYWWTDDDAILWQFADDPPAFRRTFQIDQPFQTPMQGNILPRGSGFFQMSKRP
jgi:hypothetical protein